jgi:HAD superfamily hydrolase (TIGR01509 family)
VGSDVIVAVVFDMDGVLIDSEQVWDEVRGQLARDWGGHYSPEAQRAMMGMNSSEWARYMHDVLELPRSPGEINDEVVRRILERYRHDLPLIDGAVAAVQRLSSEFPLAVASSSSRPLIEGVLDAAGITSCFTAVISSDEFSHGKPAPDVYLEAARRLGVAPMQCAAIEDSANGIRAGHAAGMRVLALPNPHYPPDSEALSLADDVLGSLHELTVERVRGIER